MGGYGRAELAPGSDLDLTVVPGRVPEPRLRAALDAVLYPLWDAGIRVSHAVRTPEECLEQARRDLSALAAWLDRRPVAGSPGPFRRADALVLAFAREARADVLRGLLEARAERARRHAALPDALEPDLKEGLGGLRDLHLLRWLAAVAGWERAVPPGAGLRAERARDLLLRARTGLHRLAGGRTDVLGAEHHAALAELLGVREEPGWEARDVLLRELSLQARWVKLLTDRCVLRAAAGEEPPPAGFRHLTRGGPWRRSARAGRWSEGARGAFLDLLRAGNAEALEELDVLGDLERLLPGWAEVRGRPQRDPYHRYPVDLHLRETALVAGRLLREPPDPFVRAAAATVTDSTALLCGALLHDVGKVGRGSHVPLGVERARQLLDAMGVGGEARDDALFLVREHLLLSDTATRRDLSDEDLVLHVAARVGDERRLALLYLLTVADALATGPAAATPWRMGLVRELVARCQRAFERGRMDRGWAERLTRAEARVREALAGLPEREVEEFLATVPPAYLLWVDPADARAHLRLVLPPPGPEEARVQARPGRLPETWAVAVGARDRLGLLASVAGAMTLAGLSVLTARAFTTEHGVALDVFEVRSAFNEPLEEDHLARLRSHLDDALAGRADLVERVAARLAHYLPTVPTDVRVAVRVDQDASEAFTVVEVEGPDRLGLLFELARTFALHGVDVHSARVATYGPRVVDAFYVNDPARGKLTDPDRLGSLVRALEEVARRPLDRTPLTAPLPPAPSRPGSPRAP
ncbi:MAG TPA: ACT domain-containing protein [Actinomycetota bacterium]|nr:ACT domain-containing protein [Actinomycetota bacterium]